METAISTFEDISHKKTFLAANPTVNGAIDLEKRSHNHVQRATCARNNDIPKTCYYFQEAAADTASKDTGASYILKRRIQTYENQQVAAMDKIITKSEIIHKFAQDVYKRLTRPVKGY